MKKCSECSGKLKELVSFTPEGVQYKYFKCSECGDEILNMEQLHSVADKYREMKRDNAKLSKWGHSIGFRIPRELAKKYNFKENVVIIPESRGIRIIPI